MTTRDAIRLRMVEATLAVLKDHEGCWTRRLPAFEQGMTDLRGLMALLAEQRGLSEADSGSATADKREKRTALGEVAAHVLNVLEVYADDAGDTDLHSRIHIPRARLWNAPTEELVAYCELLSGAAKAHAEALAPYLLDTARLGELERALAAYREVVEVPKALVLQRKTFNAAVHRTVDTAVGLLSQRLDKLVIFFRAEAPDFLEAYQRARVIGPVQVDRTGWAMAVDRRPDAEVDRPEEVTHER